MNNIVYHGSSNGDLTVLKPHKSTHMNNYVYATSNPAIALIFSVENHGDLDFDLRVVDGKIIFTERREGIFEKYNSSGYLYILDATNFKNMDNLWEGEVVSEFEEKVLSCVQIPNILKKLEEYVQNGSMIIYRYPNKPDLIPKDDSDLVEKYIGFEKMGHKGAVDNMLFAFPELQQQVFDKLETPNIFYFVGNKIDDFSNITVYDNILDAIEFADKSIFVREDGWIKYNVIDSKFCFEKGNFNFDDDFYIYEVKGKCDRISAHSFYLSEVQIISSNKIDFNNYLASEVKKCPNINLS